MGDSGFEFAEGEFNLVKLLYFTFKYTNHFKAFKIFYGCVLVCVCARVHAHTLVSMKAYAFTQVPEEDVRAPGTGVAGGFE